MKTFNASKLFCPLVLAAATMLFGSGCATQQENSYNDDYNQSLTSAPKYLVSSGDDNKFKINIHQGTMVSGEARVLDIREAASTIAKNEAMKRGWENWDLNFIREANEGWMRVVVAEVTRKKGVKYDAAPANKP
jgi:hypothetical protein